MRQRFVLGSVIDAEHDYGLSVGPQGLRITAPRCGAGEPAHIAVIAAGDELAERGSRLAVETRLGEADGVEAGCEGLIADRLTDRIRHAAAYPRPRYGA